jgi:hypothetical protein
MKVSNGDKIYYQFMMTKEYNHQYAHPLIRFIKVYAEEDGEMYGDVLLEFKSQTNNGRPDAYDNGYTWYGLSIDSHSDVNTAWGTEYIAKILTAWSKHLEKSEQPNIKRKLVEFLKQKRIKRVEYNDFGKWRIR